MDPKKKSGGVLVTRSGSTGNRSRRTSLTSFRKRILTDKVDMTMMRIQVQCIILSDKIRSEINAENKTAADRPGDL